MSIIRSFRFRKRGKPDDRAAAGAAAGHKLLDRDISDDEALRELMDILKQPYQCNCDKCWGRGILADGDDCRHCQGTGRMLMSLL